MRLTLREAEENKGDIKEAPHLRIDIHLKTYVRRGLGRNVTLEDLLCATD